MSQLNQYGPAVIRTVVPIIVTVVVSQLARRGIDAGPYQDMIANVVGGAVGAAYYALVLWLEKTIMPRIGWLLGKPGAPTYQAPAKPEGASSTGYVATEDAPMPVDTPVDIVPAEEYVGEHRAGVHRTE